MATSMSSPTSSSSLANLLKEANELIIQKQATLAATNSPENDIFFCTNLEVRRPFKKRWFTWRSRTIRYDRTSRVLEIFGPDGTKLKSSFHIKEIAVAPPKSKAFFWARRKLRMDVCTFTDQVLSLNFYHAAQHTSFLQLFSASSNFLDMSFSPNFVEDDEEVYNTPGGEDESPPIRFQSTSSSRLPSSSLSYSASSMSLSAPRRSSLISTSKCRSNSILPNSTKIKYKQLVLSTKLAIQHHFIMKRNATNLQTNKPSRANRASSLQFDPAEAERITLLAREGKQLEVFVSSPNEDFLLERTLLLLDVFPFLTELASCMGIDLAPPPNFSNSSNFSNDHTLQTLRTTSINRCKIYCQLIGNKLGGTSSSLPTSFNAEDFHGVMTELENNGLFEEVVLLTKWYAVDDNCLQDNKYVLEPIDAIIGKGVSNLLKQAIWMDVVERLSEAMDIINGGATHMPNSDLHNDVKQMRAISLENCFCYSRINQMDVHQAHNPFAACYYDVANDVTTKQANLEKIRSTLYTSLGESQFTKFENTDEDMGYQQTFLDDFSNRIVHKLVDMHEANNSPTFPGFLETEIAAHVNYNSSCCANYIKTVASEAVIEKCGEYLFRNDENKFNTPLYLHGEVGSGKTKTIAVTCSRYPQIHDFLIVRHCNLGFKSSCETELVGSLNDQVGAMFNMKDERGLSEGQNLLRKLSELGEAKRKLVLVLDGLDEMKMEMEWAWLPKYLGKGVKVIVSCNSGGLCHGGLRRMIGENEEMKVELGLVGVGGNGNGNGNECLEFVEKLLIQNSRKCTDEQLKFLATGVSHTPQRLHLVATTFLANLTSFSLPAPTPTLTAKVLNSFFDKLEAKHGELIVRASLTYIGLAAEGLSTNELLDVMSLDNQLLAVLSTHLPACLFELECRFPTLVWVNLLEDCRGVLLRERICAGGKLCWTLQNSTVRQSVLGRCDVRMQRSFARNLMDYFDGRYSMGKKKEEEGEGEGEGEEEAVDRLVQTQSFVDRWGGLNYRKIIELPELFIRCRKLGFLVSFLSNAKVIEAMLGDDANSRKFVRFETGRRRVVDWWKICMKKFGGSKVMIASLRKVIEKEEEEEEKDSMMRIIASLLNDVGRETGNNKLIQAGGELHRELDEKKKENDENVKIITPTKEKNRKWEESDIIRTPLKQVDQHNIKFFTDVACSPIGKFNQENNN